MQDQQIEEGKIREEFREKFGRFYVSVDAKTRAIRIVDIENGIKVRTPEGDEIECVASSDIEKYIIGVLSHHLERQKGEAKAYLEDLRATKRYHDDNSEMLDDFISFLDKPLK